MKAILEFNLPEEAAEHMLALDGGKWMSVCFEFDKRLRSLEKYGNRDKISVSEVRRLLREEIESLGLMLE